MGGKALKNTTTRRYAAAEFERAAEEIVVRLNTFGIKSWVVPYYRQKETFGDIDLVVYTTNPRARAVIIDLFEPNEVVHNGNIMSFDYKELQVDLIFFADLKTAEFAVSYFAFNDLGNFVGRTAHRLGFKFGHDGLWYCFRDPDCENYMFRELLVTLNFDRALEFLGFDPARYWKGFDTPEEIFEFATQSEYFDAAQFNLANRSCEARKRDRTRAMYQQILVFLTQKYSLTGDEKPTPVNREEHLQRACDWFPEFARRLAHAQQDLTELKMFKANFNGDNYTTWFNKSGKELGELMARHRAYFEHHSLRKWVGTLPAATFETVARAIEEILHNEIPQHTTPTDEVP